MEPITFKAKKYQAPNDFSASFTLQLVGSLPVHSLTTTSMLPWIVAEIRALSSTKSSKEELGISQIRLYVSPSSLRCEPDTGKIQQWDPLICSDLFEYKPQHVHKLIHNSHDPSYIACLIKDGAENQQSICYVFKADDQTKVSKKRKKKNNKTTTPNMPNQVTFRITFKNWFLLYYQGLYRKNVDVEEELTLVE